MLNITNELSLTNYLIKQKKTILDDEALKNYIIKHGVDKIAKEAWEMCRIILIGGVNYGEEIDDSTTMFPYDFNMHKGFLHVERLKSKEDYLYYWYIVPTQKPVVCDIIYEIKDKAILREKFINLFTEFITKYYG
jgi:hypothetical protein